MPNLRSKSVILILLCSAFSLLVGRALDQSSGAGVSSYRAVYYGARCLLQHADPYDPAQFSRVYMAEDAALPRDPSHRPPFLRAVMVCVNLPTTLFLLLPLALLPWGLSHLLWLAAIALSLTAAAVLAYDLTPQTDSHLPLFLVCFLMANCEVLFTVANTAGIAVGLCVISVWCFVRNRFEGFGVVCLAISLALKPHDSGLIWLWLLASGGLLRKRALQTALFVAAIALPAVLVVGQSSPHWRSELTANLAATSAHGDISDPGPASSSRKGSADIIIDLQTVLSLFNENPGFYNPASLLIAGGLLVAVLFRTIWSGASFPNAWFAVAAVSALTMLPSYHRPYDARLLLLAMPATAMLWATQNTMQKATALLSVFAIVFTADIPLALVSMLTHNLDLARMGLAERALLLPIVRPASLLLLLLAIFLTLVCARSLGIHARVRNAMATHAAISK
ncbi:DUF2029 domain-containing protein [Occallatibacter savannae]|uniref:DUF2029 domain-containing protein n=1 Tax=Occallatibacter savannae TaxID=1002691 RepID=UPI000D688BB7|nr:DUF2029 domain-containing protein [Occallatibacter savannae]